METTKTDFNKLISLIEITDYLPRSYSGRGMFGKECVGISTNNNPYEVIAAISLAALEIGSEDSVLIEWWLSNVLPHTSQDSMGLGTIIYWPNVKWNDEYQPEGSEEIEDEM